MIPLLDELIQKTIQRCAQANANRYRKLPHKTAGSDSYQSLEPRQMLAAIIAQYSADFPAAGEAPETGWQYSWNAPVNGQTNSGSLDSPDTVFFPMFDTGTNFGRTPDGDLNPNTEPASAYMSLSRFGGHPGPGDGISSEYRFAIASYTVSESGFYQVSDSFIDLEPFNRSFPSDGIEFRVFVNREEPIVSGVVDPFSRSYFDTSLGFLTVGDTIHVAYGSNGQQFADYFTTDYKIVRDTSLEQTVGSFRSDFGQTGGDYRWNYYWNAPTDWSAGNLPGNPFSGGIGNSDSYLPLVANNEVYTADGDIDGFNSDPDYFLRLTDIGGHPGNGFNSDFFQDRFTIIGYTVETSGLYAIDNSYLYVGPRSNDGVELFIHVDQGENLSPTRFVSGGEVKDFDTSLGYLQKGDTIYVAVGANSNHTFDAYQIDFSVVYQLPRQPPDLSALNHTGEIVDANRSYDNLPAAIPNDNIDDLAAIQRAIDYAVENGANEIIFAPGVYHLKPSQGTEGQPLFTLQNQSNLVFNGNGASFIIDDYQSPLFFIRDSRNIVFQDLTIDYAKTIQTPNGQLNVPQTFTQGRITNVNATAKTFTVEVNTDAFLAPDATFTLDNSQGWGYAVDEQIAGRLKDNTPWHYPTIDLESIGGNQFRIHTTDTEGLEVGDRYILQRRINKPVFGVFLGSDSVSFVDVTAYSSPSTFISSVGSSNLNVIGNSVSIRPDDLPQVPNTERWKSLNADAVHVQSNPIGPWIEDSYFEGVSDDIMNFYSRPMTVLEVTNPNRLVLTGLLTTQLLEIRESELEAGDLLTFVDTETGEIIREAKVLEVSPKVVFDPTNPGFTMTARSVLLDQPINGLESADGSDEPGFKNDVTVYNRTKANGGVVKDSILKNSRRYGNYVSVPNVQLLDNIYEGLSDEAIAAYNEPGWPLGLYPSNLLVQGNQFVNNGFSSNYRSHEIHTGTVAVQANRFDTSQPSIGQNPLTNTLVDSNIEAIRNVRILDNTFYEWSKSAITVRNAKNVTIQGNAIVSDSATNDLPIGIQYSKNVEVTENSYSGGWFSIDQTNNDHVVERDNDSFGTNGLIADYRFETGNFLLNSANPSQIAVSDGALTRDGKFGFGARFDGENSISIATSAMPLESRAISLWVNAEDANSLTPQVIFEEGNAARGMNIYVMAGKLYVGAWDTGFATFLSTDISSGDWHHIALVVDGVAGRLRGYLNGQKFGFGEATALRALSGGIHLGSSILGTRFHTNEPVGNSRSNGLVGSIDNLRVYDRLIGDREVATLARG